MYQDKCTTLRNSSIITESRCFEPQFSRQRTIEFVQIALSLFQQIRSIDHVGADQDLGDLVGNSEDLDQVVEWVGKPGIGQWWEMWNVGR